MKIYVLFPLKNLACKGLRKNAVIVRGLPVIGSYEY